MLHIYIQARSNGNSVSCEKYRIPAHTNKNVLTGLKIIGMLMREISLHQVKQ